MALLKEVRMRLRQLFVCLSLCPLLTTSGCDSSKLAGSENSTSALGSQDKNTESNPSPGDSETLQAAEAIPPVPVAGAYLSCSYSDSASEEVRCEALDDSGQPKDFTAKKVYIISGADQNWSETTFNATGVGKWVVQKPAEIKPSFAVALFNDQNAVLADWVLDANQTPPLKLADASFEDMKVDPSSQDSLQATEYLGPGTQNVWKARLASNSKCSIPYLEMKSDLVPFTASQGFIPSDGHQWIELDGTCEVPAPTAGSTGGNIVLYQDLSLVAGHIYEVSFDYMAKVPITSLQRLSVKFGDETILVKDVTESAWTSYKFTRPVSANAIRLEFEDIGIDDGRGTNLDNVRIFDLGVAPK